MLKYLIVGIFINSCLWHVKCETKKSSLVFVIDDTGSMMDDIDQVKTQVDSIFDAALNSNSSQIEDFVIVTFNDPDVKHRVTTKDRQEFKKALTEIKVDGGGDCPEMALTGLEIALQHSRNESLVYLFTDASAKDTDKMEAVKTLAVDKKCRLFFMLTGNCYDATDRVFLDLAEATGGQVFSLFKKEVGQMLGHATLLSSGAFAVAPLSVSSVLHEPVLETDTLSSAPSLFETVTQFTVDDKTKEVLVTVSAPTPEVEVTGPDGTAPKTETVVATSGSKVFKILETKPGQYTVRVRSSGRASVVVNEKTG